MNGPTFRLVQTEQQRNQDQHDPLERYNRILTCQWPQQVVGELDH